MGVRRKESKMALHPVMKSQVENAVFFVLHKEDVAVNDCYCSDVHIKAVAQ